ncbi:MAG: amidase [Betaproteobacteria bacterium]|nr:amidase [Betaproteobacteria bacterium]
MTDLTQITATDLLALYRSGEASPVQATQAVLARIAHLNPRLNAFCWVDENAALQSARESQARWQAHRQTGTEVLPLDGVPVSIKDLILTRGWPTLRGSRTVNPDQPWEVDAPVTARLREAGAVLLGKTTTPEFGCKGETNSPLTGISRNPWQLDHTPGGSSGGASAAVSAGLGPLAVGTDGAGSVRIPAAFCGNVGFKPSFGRVPAYPLSPFGSVAHLGSHAMTVADTALMMNTISRPDARDWTSLPPDDFDYVAALQAGVKGWRVAYSPKLGYVKHTDPQIAAATAQAAQHLQDLGALVEPVDPLTEDPLDITTGLWFAGAYQLWRSLTPAQQAMTDPDFQAQADLGAQLDANALHALNQRRGRLGSHLRQFMQRYDLILTPSTAVPAFRARPAGHSPMTSQAMLGWTPFSYPFNLSQQPAISLPCGLTSEGLPMGVQLVGAMFGDAKVLQAAKALETCYPLLRPTLA